MSEETNRRRVPITVTPAGAYDANGVDRSLIRASLAQTPSERLQILEELLQLAESVRRVDQPLR